MSSSKNLEFEKTAFLSKSNSAFIEEMYIKFVNNDPALPDSWKSYFNEIGEELDVVVNEINGPSWSPSKKVSIKKVQTKNNENDQSDELEIIQSNANSIKAVSMIRSYRQRGHLIAKLDPLGLLKAEYLEKYMPAPDADPHGGQEDFDALTDPVCSVPAAAAARAKSQKDEMQ